MKFYTISLFPDLIENYVHQSILGRALKNKIIFVKNFQLRDFTKDKHRRTDGLPYGGGPGMVIWLDPILNCFEKFLKEISKEKKEKEQIQNIQSIQNILIINFVPSSEKFTNLLAKNFAKKYTHIIFICGRYEGIDFRLNNILKDILKQKKRDLKEQNIKFNFEIIDLSIGDYVLTGGEVAANVLIDSISRQIKGVLNKDESLEENRISSHKIYARPEIYEKKIGVKVKKYLVPKVLLSGNHAEIEKWKLQQ